MKLFSSLISILILIFLNSIVFGENQKMEASEESHVLTLYKRVVRNKIMENWREPLGGKFNKEVIYTFNIYPKGNIDRLDLKKSSQVELLDNLALRAIHAAKPFPKFPDSLDFQNLNFSIHFKYIPRAKEKISAEEERLVIEKRLEDERLLEEERRLAELEFKRLPINQQKFIGVISTYRNIYNNEINDLRRSSARKEPSLAKEPNVGRNS